MLGEIHGTRTVLGRKQPWLWTPSLQSWETINFCYSKPPSLWYFISATLGNSYIWLVIPVAVGPGNVYNHITEGNFPKVNKIIW